MSSNQTSVFGAVVITMCVTAIGLLGGYLAVSEFLGEKPGVTAGAEEDEAAASAPQRRSSQARRGGSATADESVSPTDPAEKGAGMEEGEPSDTASGNDTSSAR